MLNVVSYVLPNLVIALILVCGVINGQKRGWKKSLIKLSYTLVLAAGLFFLNTFVIVPALVKAGNDICELLAIMPTVLWAVEFALCMGIAQLIFTIVCHSMDKEARERRRERRMMRHEDNTKKTKEAKMEEREIEKKRKHDAKLQRREEMKSWRRAHKKSRAFGAIMGFIGSAVVCFIMMLTVSNVGVAASLFTEGDSKVGETITACYDHSVMGLIDNASKKEDDETNFAEKVLVYELAPAITDDAE